jgi:CHAT domain-containing protein/tetratricopeptide (TPR) repeat protein
VILKVQRMRNAPKLPCLAWGILMLAMLAFAPQLRAQQPSVELSELRETTNALYRAGDYALALQKAEQALALVIREYGAEHEQTLVQYTSLGLVAEKVGNLVAAQRYYAQSVRIREKVYGPESAGVAQALESLGAVYIKLGQPDAAEPLFRRVLKIRQDLIGPDHAFSASGHSNLGDVSLARGNWTAALASYRQAIRLMTGQDTSQTIVKSIVEREIGGYRDTFIGLCRAAWQMSDRSAADRNALFEETFAAGQRAWNTSAASALAKMTARIGAGETDLGRGIRKIQDLSERILRLHADDNKLLADWSATQRADPAYSALSEEFRAVSIARSRDQAPTIKRQRELIERLQALSQRCPSGPKKVGCETADRERETIAKELGELSKATSVGADDIMAIHKRMEAAEKLLPGYAQFTARRTALRNDIDRSETEVRQARAHIVAAFPAYAALSDPKPLSGAETQALLKPDEALVAILVGSAKSFLWVVTRERTGWAQIDFGSEEMSKEVLALRNGLDPLAQQDAEGATGSRAGVVQGFDLERAHALYRGTLGSLEGVFAGKRHLIVVPTGPLTSLPFQVLITEPPPRGPEALRDAAWLIRGYALSVLPSVPSLSALRNLAGSASASRPFFGVGDPVLEGPDPAERQRSGRKRQAATPAGFYRNGLADIRAVRELTPLPDTADELRTIGKVLGASPDAINLRKAASETRVKATVLSDYRIVHFATHALVAGDLSGLAEPALVLTPPDVPTEADDGLLTASEIATLKLNADWVVLSACNTAAGSAEGAEALSGLARAFFYAGARALLVSHWAVYSRAATELTTKTFAMMAATPNLGRAEAFRRAMLSLIEEGKPPSYWAPFVVVGEGGVALR